LEAVGVCLLAWFHVSIMARQPPWTETRVTGGDRSLSQVTGGQVAVTCLRSLFGCQPLNRYRRVMLSCYDGPTLRREELP
jgi:hypothetical protein